MSTAMLNSCPKNLGVRIANLLWDAQNCLNYGLDVYDLLVHLLRLLKQVKQLLGVRTEQLLQSRGVLHQRLETHNQVLEDVVVQTVKLQIRNQAF